MQLQFDAISEPSEPGSKFQKLFEVHWPAYKEWLASNSLTYLPDLATSQSALEKYMPEMVPVYYKLCKLVKANTIAKQFLTGFQPPPYLAACSQAVLTKNEVQLVRNYDYHPNLVEGTLLLSAWNGKKVMGTSDCLIGLLDGMNEDGLSVSLTFGGRNIVGEGFGIPFILRYILEFYSHVDDAVKALVKIPSHMAYNVTVLDKTGAFKTVYLSPDRAPVVTDEAFATNQQGAVEWEENAEFNKTAERTAALSKLLAKEKMNAKSLTNYFLIKPLYNTLFKEGFGTIYTADYRPKEGTLQLHWKGETMSQSFDDFTEETRTIEYAKQTKNKKTKKKKASKKETEIESRISGENIPWDIVSDYSTKLRKKIKINRFKVNF
ncbi:MAG: C45 family autoproteolytic acyltransferase/hydrolase [Crocinitomicaceae bacterium]